MDGNEKTVNGQTASYDFENHLVSLASTANNTVLASYAYDADGNRVSTYVSSNNPTTTSYVVDTSLPYASVVEEYTGTSTTPSARYDYGDDLVRMDRGGVYYYLYDGLGSTRQLVNTAGAVTDTWGYSAFGELALRTSTGTPTVNPFLFNAQQFDQASGDYFLRARYYDQSNGRFISQDPFGGSNEDPIRLHRYLYAGSDPVNGKDPSGRDFELTGLLVSTSISEGLRGLVTGVDLQIYNTVSDAVQYGTEGAIRNFAIGVAISGALVVAPSVTRGLGRGLSKLGPVLNKAFSALRVALEVGCFVAGTPVHMADHNVKLIQYVKIGDVVESRDPVTGQTQPKLVKKLFVHKVKQVVTINFSSPRFEKVQEAITSTCNHMYFVKKRGFTRADCLKIGDAIVTSNGPLMFVRSKNLKQSSIGYEVYNFEVADFHTYFVGRAANGLWVHNDCDEEVRIFENLLPQAEQASISKSYKLIEDNGVWRSVAPDGTRDLAKGKYYFVRTPDGELNAWPAADADLRNIGHASLAQGDGVPYGGEIKYGGEIQFGGGNQPGRGEIQSWNNATGHYVTPDPLEYEKYAPQAGLPMDKFAPVGGTRP